MKTAASIIVLVVMPLGLFVLAAIIVNRMLAKRRQQRPERLQTSC
jgi:cytochrome c-type biogenesis protein CcmH/NrfF